MIDGAASCNPKLAGLALAMALLLSLTVAAPATGDHHDLTSNFNLKRALWKRVLGSTIEVDSRSEQVDVLASKLAAWPDQMRATLMLLELQYQNQNQDQQSLDLELDLQKRPEKSVEKCFPATIAQLSAPTLQARSRGLNLLVQWDTSSQRVPMQTLHSNGKSGNDNQNDNEDNLDKQKLDLLRLLLENNKLSGELERRAQVDVEAGLFARLALESGNFATRLLSARPAHQELVNSIVSPSLFRYFMSMRLRATSLAGQNESLLSGSSPLVALGLVHFNCDSNKLNACSLQTMQIIGPSKHQKVSKRNTNNDDYDSNESQSILVQDLDPSQVFSFASKNASSLVDLRKLAVEAPFLAHWLLQANTTANLTKLASKRKSATTNPHQEEPFALASSPELRLEDGIWWSPQLECNQAAKVAGSNSARWLLFYSVPFFGISHNSSQQQHTLR